MNMNLIQSAEAPTMASMSEVVMKKSELIDQLLVNKAKHDVILAAAIAGYWDTAASQLAAKAKRLNEQVEYYRADVQREIDRVSAKIEAKEELPTQLSIRQINIDASLGLVYPQDHSRDYERAIRMMQSSVFDQVRLTVEEYDAYVLNNWEWKQNFLAQNAVYVTSTMSKKLAFSGCAASIDNLEYATAYNTAANNVMVSGCKIF